MGGGSSQMHSVLHRGGQKNDYIGGYAQMITILHLGRRESLGTPQKSFCARLLIIVSTFNKDSSKCNFAKAI